MNSKTSTFSPFQKAQKWVTLAYSRNISFRRLITYPFITFNTLLKITNVRYYRWQEASCYLCKQKLEENMICASHWETPTYTATTRLFAIQKDDLDEILPHSNVMSSDLWIAFFYKCPALFCFPIWSIFGFDSRRTVERPRPQSDTFAVQLEAGFGCRRANGIRRRVFFR